MYLQVHLDDGLADECGTKEGPERHQKMTTRDAGQVKQGVRNLFVCIHTRISHESATQRAEIFTR